MDALDLLKSDHLRISGLFGQFQNTSGLQGQLHIFNSIRTELESHAHLEEMVFYPRFRSNEETKDIIERSFEEHQEVKNLLQEIEGLKNNAEQFAAKVRKLQESVEHHVQEEEGELFSKVRQIMKRPEREQLGRHMQAAKDETFEAAA